MPTYEYACRDCAHELEVVQSFSDDPLTVCPSCGGTLRKRFSAAGIIFKGSGYYVTDSRSAPAPNGKPAPAKEPAAEGSASGSGSGSSTPGGDSAGGGSGSGSSGSGSGGSSKSGGSGSGGSGSSSGSSSSGSSD